MMILIKKRIKYSRLKIILINGFLIVITLIQPLLAQEVLWFSNTPPKHEKKITTSGMHRLSAIKGKRGRSSVIQWLRKGNSVENAVYSEIVDEENFEFYLFSPTQKKIESEFTTKHISSFFMYSSKEEGYYNGYFISKKVIGDTLQVIIAKSEMLNHSCRNGHKNISRIIDPFIYPETIPVEIIRKREFTEDFHYFATSSDEVAYTLLLNGKPVEDANLTLITQTDWRKTLKTNRDGNCTFQLIQDYFSPWKELDNRKIYYYLMYGEITVQEKGIYNEKEYSNVHYVTSLSDGYRPAKTMYTSMFWALALFILTIVITVVGIFIYRLKRSKVYKEIKLDEKN